MPTDSRRLPIQVRVEKIDCRACTDTATRKALSDAITDLLGALFRARRGSFRVVSGNVGENGLLVRGNLYLFDVSERTVNGQTVEFRLGIGAAPASRTTRMIAERHFGWDNCPVDPSQRFPAWAVSVVTDCVRREVRPFLDECERWAEQQGA